MNRAFTITVITAKTKEELIKRMKEKAQAVKQERLIRKALIYTSKQDGSMDQRRELAQRIVAKGFIS